MPTTLPLPIGYLHLRDLVAIMDRTIPLYIAPIIESSDGPVHGQRLENHYIMVTQPDVLNRIHYCRISVVQLIYHNSLAFAPDQGTQLEKVDGVRRKVETWLAGEGYTVQAGMVAIPLGMRLIEGSLSD